MYVSYVPWFQAVPNVRLLHLRLHKKFWIKISFKSKLLHNRFIFLIDDYLFGAHVMNVQLIT